MRRAAANLMRMRIEMLLPGITLDSEPYDYYPIKRMQMIRFNGESLARISHTIECIGAANQRKLLCCNDLSPIRGAPRCPQSVPRISLGLNPLKDARW